MNEETKRKLEAEEKRHNEEMKRILAEKESGWNCWPSVDTFETPGAIEILTNYCFSSRQKAKEYAAKIELFLRMSKWCEENSLDPIHAICYVHALSGYITFPVAYCLPEGIDIFKKEILKIWVMGEYE